MCNLFSQLFQTLVTREGQMRITTKHLPRIRRYQHCVYAQSSTERFSPSMTASAPRLCKNIFARDRYSKPDLKSCFYAKSTSADVPINFRFNVDARTSILAKRFYTLWAVCCRSRSAALSYWRPVTLEASRPISTSCACSPARGSRCKRLSRPNAHHCSSL